MKKFFSILAGTAMSVAMLPASAATIDLSTVKLGEGICSVIVQGGAENIEASCKDMLCLIPGFDCGDDSCKIPTLGNGGLSCDDLLCLIPGINCQPDCDTELVPPVQDDTPSDTPEQAPPQEDTDTPSQESTISEYEREVINLVNEIRAEYGLGALAADEELSRVARIKSQDMKDNNYFSHTSPTYGSPFDMMKSFGISYKTAGENIAKGYMTPQAVVDGWMNSEGHRANILNASFNTIGVGYVAEGNYWTQMFVGR